MSRRGLWTDNPLVPSGSTFLLFAAASLGLLVVPGPAVLYIVTRSVEQGRRAGFASVLGVHIGTTVHIVAAAAGLSALLVSSATAFSAVKYAGSRSVFGACSAGGRRRTMRGCAVTALVRRSCKALSSTS